jgi:hypothetical protein
MSVRNGFVLLLAFSALLFLAACGGSGNSVAKPVPPPSGTFSNSNLNGTYVFSVSGTDASGFPYAVVGTIAANGSGGNNKGAITGGTIDINDSEFTPAPGLAINSNGSYSVGTDGRGQFTIATTTSNPFNNFGNGTMVFDFVLSSSSHGLITQFDGNGSGSGTIDLQTANIAPTGTYAFSFFGISALTSTSAIPAAAVGAFTLNSSGTITASASDFNNNNFVTPNQALSGTVALGPSATPSTTLTTPFGALIFDVYAIDGSHLKFIETDTVGPLLSGDAFSQTATTISGTNAFTLAGSYLGNVAAAGGFMVTDGSGTITSGTEDYNNGGASSSVPAFSGSYSSAGSLIPGRLVLTLSGFFGGSTFAAYPSSGGLLLLESDGTGVMTGAAYPQTTTAFSASSQGYALNLSGANAGIGNGSVEVDDIAEFTASAAASSAGTLTTGIIDENFDPGGTPNLGLSLSSGTYGAIDSTGRYGLSVKAGNSSRSTLNGGLGLTFYTVDGTTFPFIETDTGGQVSTGVFVIQNPTAAASAAASQSHMFVPQPLVRAHITRQKKN